MRIPSIFITCLLTTAVFAITSCTSTATQPLPQPAGPQYSDSQPSASQPPASTPANSQANQSDEGDEAEVNLDARPFPRTFTIDGRSFKIHQPQFQSWKDNQLSGEFVMAVDTGDHVDKAGKSEESYDYGVVQYSARTQIDKGARAVVLTDLKVDSVNFPTAMANQDHYLAMARAQLKATPTLTMSLDQLESAIAIAQIDSKPNQSVAIKNDVPDIIFTTKTAMLILIDGQPALRDTNANGVQRVINSRSLILLSAGSYYTVIGDKWLKAAKIEGPWTLTSPVSASLQKAKQQAIDDKLVSTIEDPPTDLKDELAKGQIPEIFVRTHPSELITVQGDPEFLTIDGTSLSFINNTGADVFIDAAKDNDWYVLISGRWFTAATSKGPWTYVPTDKLPGEFNQIPADNPKSGVLASIPGTPEAQESLIANDIPQTASVDPNKVSLSVQYDGAPQFGSIDGTSLQYAKNTAVPVIMTSTGAYYAVDKGVWFTANVATGPWTVATSVPSEIYSIPSSSPLHYITYVRIYGGNANEVYVGYTPGYYGTVVSNNVVVYGTGYGCSPWIGAYWYGCPATYGMGVYFGWNPWVGWTFGMGWGFYAGWYGAWAPWWGPWYGPVHPWGWWGGGAAAWNVYGHWGNAAVRGTAGAWANPWTGNYGRAGRGGYYNERTGGRGMGRAGVNTNIYTGTTRAGAQGARYNPQTGRAVGGNIHGAVNPYTDQAGVGGRRTAVNTNTGRVTNSAGGAVAGKEGAAGAGGFNSKGPGGNVAGAGGFHYNADTGTLNHGGVVKAGDNYYAGHDGNVYHHDGDGWNKVDPKRNSSGIGGGNNKLPQNLDSDRMARDRGNQRIGGSDGMGNFQSHDRGGFQQRGGGFNRNVGGFRSGLGARPMGGFGGGFRGGGFRGGGFRR